MSDYDPYSRWLLRVGGLLRVWTAVYHLEAEDIDCPYRKWFDVGITPKKAALRAVGRLQEQYPDVRLAWNCPGLK